MTKLIVVGHSAFGGVFGAEGKSGVGRLIDELKPEWKGASISIVSAPSARTRKAASVIAAKTNGAILVVDDLGSTGLSKSTDRRWNRIMERLDSQTADVVFVVANRNETATLPSRVVRSAFSSKEASDSVPVFSKLDSGGSYVLDLKQKTVHCVYVT